ncbi:MAG: MscL family protein, partial [Waterburya sp.]
MVRRGSEAAGGFLAGFRDFIMQGNVIDLAVAVIIGA